MASRRSLTLDPGAGTALSYVRSRRMLRLARSAEPADAIELPVSAFLDELGVDVTDLVPARQYLLFGGTDQRPAGGAGDILDTFVSETEARMAFRELRRCPEYRHGWAELVALDAGGRAQRLSWFGGTKVRWPLRRSRVSGQ